MLCFLMFFEYLSLMPTCDAKRVLIAACGIFTAQVEQAVSLAKEMRAKLQETGSIKMGKTENPARYVIIDMLRRRRRPKYCCMDFFWYLTRWLDCCFYLHDHQGFWGTQLDSSQLLAPDTEPDAFLKSEHRNFGPWHLRWAWLPELVANTCDQMHQPWRRSFCPWRRWMLSRLEASKPQRLHVLWRNLQQERRWPIC